MLITEVRFVFPERPTNGKFIAYANITFDNELAVHRVRLLRVDGRFLVAFPSEKVHRPCHACECKCDFDDTYCRACGKELLRQSPQERGHHHDLAHPITPEFREYVEGTVIDEYRSQTARHSAS